MPRVKKETTTKEVKKVIEKKVTTPRSSGLSVPVYSLAGRSSGTLSLPKEIFGKEVNKTLLAQALRVYMTNKKVLPGSTKTRGEVQGSTAKIFKQKGTGRARHGSIRAPIFVGGGIVFGPTPRKVRLDLPKKMKRSALISALSEKFVEKKVVGLSGLEKASGKTKEMVKLVYSLWGIVNGQEKNRKTINHKPPTINALIITGEKTDNVVRAVKNISSVSVLPANLINAYEVLKHDMLLITKEAVDKLTKPINKEQK